VHQDEAFYASALRRRVETAGAQPADRFLVLLHRWKAAQFPDTEEARRESPIANYSERDLVNFVRDSGFNDIHVQLEIDVKPALITSWEVFIASSPHPWAPPGANTTTDRVVYVSATKPRSRPGAPLLPGT
jgi:hypothetical protein